MERNGLARFVQSLQTTKQNPTYATHPLKEKLDGPPAWSRERGPGNPSGHGLAGATPEIDISFLGVAVDRL